VHYFVFIVLAKENRFFYHWSSELQCCADLIVDTNVLEKVLSPTSGLNVETVYLSMKIETVCFPEIWYLLSNACNIFTQQTNIDIFTTVRTSNLKKSSW
jgi:hypothetical protein